MSCAAAEQAAAKGAAEATAAKGTAALAVAASGSAAATRASATEAAAKRAAATGAAANGTAASGAAASGEAASGAAASGATASAAATGAEATGAAATRAAVLGAAAPGTGASGGAAKECTEAAAGGAAPPAKRLKANMAVSRASARFAVVSKKRDGCLLGSSVTESPEKLRGYHEIIDSFIIEYEDDKLHREEGFEKETDEGSETKEVDECTEPVQGPLPTPPLARLRRLTCSCCLEVHRDWANSLCSYCGFKLL